VRKHYQAAALAARNPSAAHCGRQLNMADHTLVVSAAAHCRGSVVAHSGFFAQQDAWNLRGTFSLSVAVLAAAIIPLFAIFVRYSDKLSYR